VHFANGLLNWKPKTIDTAIQQAPNLLLPNCEIFFAKE
jgi:hypothetical protein